MFSPSWTAEYTISFRLRMCKQVSRPLLMPQSKPQKWQSHSNHSSLLKNIPIALWRYWTSVAKKGITPKRHRLKMAQIISAWEGVVDSFHGPCLSRLSTLAGKVHQIVWNNFLTGTLSPCVDVRALCWICLGLSRTRVWVGMNDEIPQSQKQCMNPSQKKCHNMSHYPRVCGFKSVVFEAPIKGNHGENKAPVSLRTLLSWPSSSDISRKSPRRFMVMLPQRHGCTVVPWKNVPRESSVNLKLREIPWAINQNVDQFR